MKLDAPSIQDDLMTWLTYWGHVHVTGIDLGLERVIPVAEKLGVTQTSAKVFTVAILIKDNVPDSDWNNLRFFGKKDLSFSKFLEA